MEKENMGTRMVEGVVIGKGGCVRLKMEEEEDK